ncbi:hypothetical protein GCM10022222_35730 [Amycolatopsis ultiminotia]|uniref:Uncharacterized protein n=1 Tax=Amycolatopsis ultiminotia TaxID=543629 RepID=A0ABP6WCS3_9PSEU
MHFPFHPEHWVLAGISGLGARLNELTQLGEQGGVGGRKAASRGPAVHPFAADLRSRRELGRRLADGLRPTGRSELPKASFHLAELGRIAWPPGVRPPSWLVRGVFRACGARFPGRKTGLPR